MTEKSLKVSKPKKYAGGFPAVTKATEFIFREVGCLNGVKTLLRVNQKKGFDCPGCAWPEPDQHRSPFEFCENGAKAIAEEATQSRITPDFFQRYDIEELNTKNEYWLGQQGRLTQPVMIEKGQKKFQPITWEDAFGLMTKALQSLPTPDHAIFYTSGRTSNEAAFLYQLFAKQLGTNNLPDCSNLCHESSGSALSPAIGIGKGTVKLSDFPHADLILVIGQNPGTNHPRMLSTLKTAVEAGSNVISINPLKEAGLIKFRHPQSAKDMLGPGAPLASEHIPVRLGGDFALFRGMAKHILTNSPQGIDPEFIATHSEGFADYRDQVEKTPWDSIIKCSGLSKDRIISLAERVLKAKSLISCWAMGLTQHREAVATIREVTNLHLLGGFIGTKGSGLCPVRGHSNVQGDRTMGIWEKPPEKFLKAIDQRFGIRSPRNHGYDVVEAIQAMQEGRGHFFMAMGGNLLSASPDTNATAKALGKVGTAVHVATKLNRTHLTQADRTIILPCLGRTEEDIQETGAQEVTVENSMGIVHPSKGTLTPASPHLKSEVHIIASLGRSLFPDGPIAWHQYPKDYSKIRDEIAAVIPGFANFNRKISNNRSFYLPNPPRDERKFQTASGKAEFLASELPPPKDTQGRLVMMTIRSHDQYNTTIYGLDDRYRGITGGRRVIFMNREDIEKQGLQDGEQVDISSFFEGVKRSVKNFRVVPYDIPQGNVATYFPECNPLIPLKSVAKKSNTPTSKWVEVEVYQAM